jgi:hypothetical protein
MNFCFHSAATGLCTGRLWATGRYGFSLPKKVEITTPSGVVHTYLYPNRSVQFQSELANRTIVRIAIAQFLARQPAPGSTEPVDAGLAPYKGTLTPIRPPSPRTPLRVHPGKHHARPVPEPEPGP